ncbi:MAG: hypothetical protein LBV47_07260 [Bacteroidales bacterium]|jgi:hypothetical protein|nr:hypothetical protein [Bacteroidales bacterium]
MASALKANLEILEKRGMTQDFINVLEDTLVSITTRNKEQERLKADKKTTTASINTLMAQLHTQMQEAVKVVKLGVPQTQWVEFGIKAKR